MTRDQLVQTVEVTYSKCLEIIDCKNKGYAVESDAFCNFRAISNITGLPKDTDLCFLNHIGSKFTRLIGLVTGSSSIQNTESIEDTLVDLINYCAIYKAYRENN